MRFFLTLFLFLTLSVFVSAADLAEELEKQRREVDRLTEDLKEVKELAQKYKDADVGPGHPDWDKFLELDTRAKDLRETLLFADIKLENLQRQALESSDAAIRGRFAALSAKIAMGDATDAEVAEWGRYRSLADRIVAEKRLQQLKGVADSAEEVSEPVREVKRFERLRNLARRLGEMKIIRWFRRL